MTIPSGRKLGRYDIRSKVGAGGTGEAYLAEAAQLRRQVALELLPVSSRPIKTECGATFKGRRLRREKCTG